jgi:hypothetical protein
MLRASEAAAAWSISRQTLNRAATSGRIPSHLWQWEKQHGVRGRNVRLFHPDAQQFAHGTVGRPPLATKTNNP